MNYCPHFTAGDTSSQPATEDPGSAREELQHQAVDLGGVLVRGPVAGARNPVEVEAAVRVERRLLAARRGLSRDRLPDLADQEVRGTERGIVALAPEEAEPAAERAEIAQQRAAAADLAAIEAAFSDAVDLDVERLLGDARRVAQHIDQQVVAADLAEELVVVARFPVAARRAVAEAARGE